MSPSVMQITPQDIDTAEKRARYTVAITDCTLKGVLQACLFGEAGFKVICTDLDQAKTENIAKGKPLFLHDVNVTKFRNLVRNSRISVLNDSKAAMAQGDIVVFSASPEIDQRGRLNLAKIENRCKQLGSSIHRGIVVIITEALGVNITEGLIKQLLENMSGLKAGVDFGLAYSPLPLDLAGTDVRRVVAATDKKSLDAASTIIATISEGKTKKTNGIRLAEAASLLESSWLSAYRALALEFAILCEKLGNDYSKSLALLPSVFDQPITVQEDEQTSVMTLLEQSESFNVRLRILDVATNSMKIWVEHGLDLVKDALKTCGKSIGRARVAVLGLSQKPNVYGLPSRQAIGLVKKLHDRGAKITLFDSYLLGNDVPELRNEIKKTLNEAAEGADCLLILTGHDQFRHMNLGKLRIVMKSPASIVDLVGIVHSDKIEKDGFTYRGLGGVWAK